MKSYPNAEYVPDDLINRRSLYRFIERIAGMTVPQFDRDCMGDSVPRPDPKPAAIYAHVLKAIVAAQATDESGNAKAATPPVVCVNCGQAIMDEGDGDWSHVHEIDATRCGMPAAPPAGEGSQK